MKKTLMLLLCTGIFTFISCDDEPLESDLAGGDGVTSCATAVANTAQAAINFSAVNVDTYTQLCNAYRDALIAQISACGDDDGTLQLAVDALGDCTDDNQQATDIEGTWLLTAWIAEEGLDLNNDGTASLNFLDEMDCYDNETLVFNSDGTAVSTTNSYADIIYVVEIGDVESITYTVNCIEETEVSNGTWSQSGNIITLSDEMGGNSSDWTLSGNELSIFIPSGFFSQSEDGSATTIQDLTFIYTKQ